MSVCQSLLTMLHLSVLNSRQLFKSVFFVRDLNASFYQWNILRDGIVKKSNQIHFNNYWYIYKITLPLHWTNEMEVMSTHSAALQHPTPPPSHCPGDTDTLQIFLISRKLVCCRPFVICLSLDSMGNWFDFPIVYCWKVEAVMLMILSVGESRPRPSCRVMAPGTRHRPSVRICTLQTREHQLGVWFSSSESQLLKLNI